jgi:hypothetical protein
LILSLVATSPLAAQASPFAFTGGSVKSAYIVYDLLSKGKAVPGASWESGVTPDRWIMRMKMPMEIGGKKDTVRSWVVETRDSQYKYNSMGAQRGDADVSPTLRFHLAREYAALNAAAKARFKENLKLGTRDNSSASSDMDMFITLTGDKVGSETVAGHKCDVYKREGRTACVVPGAPMVMLRWVDEKEGTTLEAKKVTLNGAVPTVASVLPKGVQWQKKPASDADFIQGIWTLKKQSDPEVVPPAQLAKFAVGYLASPAATAEIREMSGGMGGDEAAEDESGGAESPDESGN